MLKVLKKRCDFLSVAKRGVFVKGRGCLIQVCLVKGRYPEDSVIPEEERKGTQAGPFPFFWGITASKKVGNSVLRNKAKRRLRAWVRESLENVLGQKLASLSALQAQVDSKNCISLSQRTFGFSTKSQDFRKSFWPSQKKGVALSEKNSSQKMFCSLAFVFIATKTTGSLEWAFLRNEIEKTLLTGLAQLTINADS